MCIFLPVVLVLEAIVADPEGLSSGISEGIFCCEGGVDEGTLAAEDVGVILA